MLDGLMCRNILTELIQNRHGLKYLQSPVHLRQLTTHFIIKMTTKVCTTIILNVYQARFLLKDQCMSTNENPTGWHIGRMSASYHHLNEELLLGETD